MGKGDRKTAKGKRFNSSYGNARAHGIAKASAAVSAPVLKKPGIKAAAPGKSAAAKSAGKKVVKKVAA